jgi:hypothetical protein
MRIFADTGRGFRLSLSDTLLLVACGAATWLLWDVTAGLVVFAPVALGHFFLFCNVFRVGRNPELVWAGCFFAIALVWLLRQPWPWWWLVVLPSPVSVGVIVHAIRRPDYHGIFAGR